MILHITVFFNAMRDDVRKFTKEDKNVLFIFALKKAGLKYAMIFAIIHIKKGQKRVGRMKKIPVK